MKDQQHLSDEGRCSDLKTTESAAALLKRGDSEGDDVGDAGGPRLPQQGDAALWSGTNKNQDVSTGPLVRSFARTACSLAPHYSLHSRTPLRSLAHFAHSLARGKVNY